MTNYVGISCPVCDKKFVAEDDVVVCPVCGAPHHRECYAVENKCAYEAQHITGKEWKPAQEAAQDFCINPQNGEQWQAQGMEFKLCPYCNSKNPKDNIFCCSCGNRLANISPGGVGGQAPVFSGILDIDPATAIYGGVSPSDKIGDFYVRDVAAFVGRSSAHYIPQFKAESEDSRRVSISPSAFLFSFFYFFYRKMYKIGAIILAIVIILNVPSMLYLKENLPVLFKDYFGAAYMESLGIDIDSAIEEVDGAKVNTYLRLMDIAGIINMSLRVLCALFATKLYYRHTMKRMQAIREKAASKGGYKSAIAKEMALKDEGGINNASVFIIAGLMLLVIGASSIAMTFGFLNDKNIVAQPPATETSEFSARTEYPVPEFKGENLGKPIKFDLSA